jgi:hypothetical protein
MLLRKLLVVLLHRCSHLSAAGRYLSAAGNLLAQLISGSLPSGRFDGAALRCWCP